MNDRDLTHLHPTLKPICEQWLAICHKQSIPAFVIETYRSAEEQDRLYAQGRTTPGKIVTNAKGGQSKHNFTVNDKPASMAFDWAIKNTNGTVNWDWHSSLWQTAAVIGKSLGLIYGGDWSLKDADHFELPPTD